MLAGNTIWSTVCFFSACLKNRRSVRRIVHFYLATNQRYSIATIPLPWLLLVLETIASGQLVQALDQIQALKRMRRLSFLYQWNAK
ncbi:MAG: hypothetical protein WBR24_11590 [Desulfobacterales bacterium]